MDIIETMINMKHSMVYMIIEWEGQEVVKVPIKAFVDAFESLGIENEDDIPEFDSEALLRIKMADAKINNQQLYIAYKYIDRASNHSMASGGYRVLADGLIAGLIWQEAKRQV